VKLGPGQVAVVTGAASGIGLALTKGLVERGLAVVMADIEGQALENAAAFVDGVVLPVRTDISDSRQINELRRRTNEHFGRVDVLVNNAGITTRYAPMWEMDELDWQWSLGVNLWGVVNGVRSFVPQLVERGHGHVVNVASMSGIGTVPWAGPYGVAKHAVVALSETLRAELDARSTGVGVTVVSPGRVRTRITTSERNRPAHLKVNDVYDSVPGRLPVDGESMMEPEQMAVEIIEAIEANRLHCAPGAAVAAMSTRVDRLCEDLKTYA
jgi:NAD(P)-dependent dehydrogenase (short-subunit alcohol dehydrogenase family)